MIGDFDLRRMGLAAGVVLLTLMAGTNSFAARGDVKVPAIFGSHMVLQRDQKDRVWGWAESGRGGHGQDRRPEPRDQGRRRRLVAGRARPDAGRRAAHSTIQGKNTLKFDDVLVGEVWICSGQSNMQWSVAAAKDADLEIATAKYPTIRLITVPNRGTQEPQKDFQGQWQPCRPDTVGGFSAVGYFFGRRLHQTLDVPIGLINDSWGGSACEAWIRRDMLAADEKYAPLLKRWEKLEKDLPRAKAEYESKLAEWRAAADKAKAEGKQPPRARRTPRTRCGETPGPATSTTACSSRRSATASAASSGIKGSRTPAGPISIATCSP